MTDEERRISREKVFAGLKIAVARALEEHRRAGRKVAVWKDGKAVRLPVEEAIQAAADEERRETSPEK